MTLIVNGNATNLSGTNSHPEVKANSRRNRLFMGALVISALEEIVVPHTLSQGFARSPRLATFPFTTSSKEVED